MSNSIFLHDYRRNTHSRYSIMIRKDGVVGYCTLAWSDGKKHYLEFKTAQNPFFLPYLFDSEEEAAWWFTAWQRSFPADADGWIADISEYEV